MRNTYTSEIKFTPGPWVANGTTVVAGSATFRALFDCKPLSMTLSGDECAANAQLISQSPVMYEALKECSSELQCAYDWMKENSNMPTVVATQRLATIKKAKAVIAAVKEVK